MPDPSGPDSTDLLTMDERYVGLAIGGHQQFPTLPGPDQGLRAWLYGMEGWTIAIVLGGQHPEPLIAWLQSLERGFAGSSLLVSLVASDAAAPPTSDFIEVVRLPTEGVTPEVRSVVLSGSIFSLALPGAEELWLFCGPEQVSAIEAIGVSLSPDRMHLRLVDSVEPAKVGPEPRTTSPYDPIGAQISETLSRTSVTFRQRLDSVRVLLNRFFGIEESTDLDALAEWAETRIALTKTALDSEELRATAIRQVDLLSQVLRVYADQLTEFGDQLRRYEHPGNPAQTRLGFSELAEHRALHAVRATVSEAVQRIAGPEKTLFREPARVEIVPVLGREYTTFMLIQSSLLDETLPQEMRIAVLQYPRLWALRSGALPLIAHGITHPLLNLGALSWMIAQDPAYSGVLVELGESLDEEPSDPELGEAHRRLTEMFADLIGCAVMGPAYFYALCRFVTGHLHGGQPQEAVPMERRIRTCLRFLRALDFETPLQTEFLDEENSRSSDLLRDLVLGLVGSPYNHDDHQAVPAVQAKLQGGQVVDAPCSVLLNALWDAVNRRADYVNELALFESLAARDVHLPRVRSSFTVF